MCNSQIIELIRSIHARPHGTGALLNLIRASEVRGAADLSALSEVISDAQLRLDVARHAADEARHAYLLMRRIHEIGFAASRLPAPVDRTEGLMTSCRARDPKRVYAERGTFTDEELYETLVAASIAERDAIPKLEANYAVLAHAPRTQAVIGSILRDEERHVNYLGNWLERLANRVPAELVCTAHRRLSDRFSELNVAFYAAFDDYLGAADARLAS